MSLIQYAWWLAFLFALGIDSRHFGFNSSLHLSDLRLMFGELLNIVALGDFTLPFRDHAFVCGSENGFETTMVTGDEKDRIDVLFERDLCDEASLVASPTVW